LQAGLGWVVAFEKRQFRGRQALLHERDRGLARHLVGIATEGRRPPRADCTVLVDERPVGTLTSGNFSPILGHGIGLGFVEPNVTIGDQVAIDVRGSQLAGRVVATPFVSR
jgi:aminomethyltransferase